MGATGRGALMMRGVDCTVPLPGCPNGCGPVAGRGIRVSKPCLTAPEEPCGLERPRSPSILLHSRGGGLVSGVPRPGVGPTTERGVFGDAPDGAGVWMPGVGPTIGRGSVLRGGVPCTFGGGPTIGRGIDLVAVFASGVARRSCRGTFGGCGAVPGPRGTARGTCTSSRRLARPGGTCNGVIVCGSAAKRWGTSRGSRAPLA
jgi:hypothetical protein